MCDRLRGTLSVLPFSVSGTGFWLVCVCVFSRFASAFSDTPAWILPTPQEILLESLQVSSFMPALHCAGLDRPQLKALQSCVSELDGVLQSARCGPAVTFVETLSLHVLCAFRLQYFSRLSRSY